MKDYPLLQEYIEAIKFAEDNFEALKHLRPVLGEDGEPIMSSGNFAVVFKMKNVLTDKFYAIKCFLRDQEGREEAYRMISEVLSDVNSSYLTSITYIEDELFVDSKATYETEFPVLLMDWVEGKTLDKYIRENLDDQYALEMLAYQFSRLAMWLLPQPFAHGDLKPDNIIVREDGTLTLVDYDGMYVPAMKGQMARELGSPGFRHPSRMVEEFNEHIDDFPIASILLSLKAIALQPTLLEEYGASDRLLLSEEDYRNISQSLFFRQVFPSDNMELNKLMNLFMLALSENNLSGVSSSLFNLQKPEMPEIDIYSTEVTEEDLANAWIDEYGVKYSADRKRLLKAPADLWSYSVIDGTLVICDHAFLGGQDEDSYIYQHEDHPYWGCYSIHEIRIPDSVVSIGKRAFTNCIDLKHLRLPNNLMHIGEAAFATCIRLTSIIIPKNLKIISSEAFAYCENLQSVIISDGVEIIEYSAFSHCESLKLVLFPESLHSIKLLAFKMSQNPEFYIPPGTKDIFESRLRYTTGYEYELKLVENVFEPEPEVDTYSSVVSDIDLNRVWIDEYGVKYSKGGKRLFKAIEDIETYSIRVGTNVICNCAFRECEFLSSIDIPNSVATIGVCAFDGCYKLSSIDIPNSVTTIESYAFSKCHKMSFIVIPNSVTSIGDYAFSECSGLASIVIPKNVVKIGHGVLEGCNNLISLEVDKENKYLDSRGNCNAIIEKNSNTLIAGCSTTYIPNSIIAIGDNAFSLCKNLKSIIIPDKVTYIGKSAFAACKVLSSIILPENLTIIDDDAFEECAFSSIILPEKLTGIGERAFQQCTNLTSIVIPENVFYIGACAFRLCYNLTSITIPNEVEFIGSSTFSGCYHLRSIVIPNSVEVIKNNIFDGCHDLDFIVIPNSVTTVEYWAFRDSHNLKTIAIPESVSLIDESAFEGCDSLEEILIPPKSLIRFEQLLPKYKNLLKEV